MEDEDPVINLQESLTAAMHEGDAATAAALMPEIHPAELAAAYEALAEEEREALLPVIPAEMLPPFLRQLPVADAVEILGRMPDGPVAAALEELSDDVLVDLLQEMPPTQRGHTFHLLSDTRHRAARELLRYPEDTAGGRMTTAFATVREDMTVREAIRPLLSPIPIPPAPPPAKSKFLADRKDKQGNESRITKTFAVRKGGLSASN